MTPHETKYVYLFPAKSSGSLFKHYHIYRRWTGLVRENGLEMSMVGFLPLRDYLKNRAEIASRTEDEPVTIVPTPAGGRIHSLSVIIYFVLVSLWYRQVVVHGRKVSVSTRLELAKKVVGDRLKYTVELEGDNVLEAAYANEHPVDSHFYADTSVKEVQEKQQKTVKRPDHIFTVTEELRENLIARYPGLDLEQKTTAIMSDFPDEVGYDSAVRTDVRERLGIGDRFVYTYIGSVAPLWQNAPRTIEIFRMLYDESERTPFLLLLVREQEHHIVEELLEKHDIPDSAYHLVEVEPDAVRSYLFASDIGVMLRDNHPMCEVVFGGKYLDYLSAGLPVLTTSVAKWADEIATNDYGIVLEDLSDDNIVLDSLKQFETDAEKRVEIAEWAAEKFNVDRQIDQYIAVLRSLARDRTPL